MTAAGTGAAGAATGGTTGGTTRVTTGGAPGATRSTGPTGSTGLTGGLVIGGLVTGGLTSGSTGGLVTGGLTSGSTGGLVTGGLTTGSTGLAGGLTTGSTGGLVTGGLTTGSTGGLVTGGLTTGGLTTRQPALRMAMFSGVRFCPLGIKAPAFAGTISLVSATCPDNAAKLIVTAMYGFDAECVAWQMVILSEGAAFADTVAPSNPRPTTPIVAIVRFISVPPTTSGSS
ncbi:hypothetical protein [Arthrobacter sp. MMS18-M83]|uniref:hypothetical protein n=1 Tax=Arthrobacter sp. MMS18-M83 TaxID=2996261 RepID=UPI00227CB25D|nr:hypothetical protein [Arthrobacter sp. MMS18-M83]WAH96670.1 hypothetical protein OW521_20135 [Arthrobacter sp. MMS18-M83]